MIFPRFFCVFLEDLFSTRLPVFLHSNLANAWDVFDAAPVCVASTPMWLSLMIRCMKRTTLILEESCLEGIRNLARRKGKKMSEVANELFAQGLRRRRAKRRPGFELVSYSMGKPKVNLGDRNALEALMDS
jgi:hypothetical protein